MRAASIAIISAIIATTAATTMYCVGQYFVFGAIFLEIGITPFIAPGLPIMLGVGGFLNFYLLSREPFPQVVDGQGHCGSGCPDGLTPAPD